jgi:hypothetical protein
MAKGLVKADIKGFYFPNQRFYVTYLKSSFTLMVTKAIAAKLHPASQLILSSNTAIAVVMLFSSS